MSEDFDMGLLLGIFVGCTMVSGSTIIFNRQVNIHEAGIFGVVTILLMAWIGYVLKKKVKK